MSNIEIFTDGACKGNPGDGGWGAIIRINDQEEFIWGGEKETTNNRMEMMAAIKALEYLEESSDLTLTTDSGYVKDGITKYLQNWKKNGWKTSARKPVKNKDLWLELYDLNKSLNTKWNWVKAHAGNPMNEEADLLAKKAANLD